MGGEDVAAAIVDDKVKMDIEDDEVTSYPTQAPPHETPVQPIVVNNNPAVLTTGGSVLHGIA